MSGNGDARSYESSGEATLQEELSAAMRTPLVEPAGSRAGLQADAPEPQPHWQTSESHPIV